MVTTTTPVRRPRRDAIENRAGILLAATEAIARDPRASVDEIARTAGLSRRALYGHFPDRDALVRDVIATGAQRFNAVVLRIDDDDPRVALARLASLLWQEAAHVQVVATLALDETHVHDTAVALAPLREAVGAIVRRGQEQAVLRTDMPAATLARLIEEAARSAITRIDASSPEARAIAVKAALSIAGLSWQASVDLLSAHPGILEED